MDSTRKVLVIAGTGLRRLLRDRGEWFFLFAFPLLLVLTLGSVFGNQFGGGSQAHVGVAAPSDDELADEVVAALDREQDLDVSHYSSARSLRSAVELGTVQAGIVIPEGYVDQLLAGGTAEIGLVARPGGLGAQLRPVVEAAVGPQAVRLQSARFGSTHGTAGLDAALQHATRLDAALPDVTVATSTVGEERFPRSLGRFDVGASSQLVLFMFINGLAASAALVRSRELGVSRRMLSTPTPTWVVLVGEMCSRLAVCLFQGIYIMVATWVLFGVDWGDLVGSLTVLLTFALVPAGAAMLFGAVFSNDQQATAVSVISGLVLAALGGSMAPLELFSSTMRTVAHVTPHAWANDAFAELVRHDGTVVDVLPELSVLLVMAAALLVLAVWRLHRTLTTTS